MSGHRIGIIGAGMAGLACAELLATSGCELRLFDKGRGPGGRMSSRRVSTEHGEAMFDHGAQYVTARDPEFVRTMEAWRSEGVVAPWPQAGGDVWVGTPQMNAIPKRLARGLDITFSCMIRGLTRSARGWSIVHESGSDGPFDAVVVALPAEQAASILGLHDLLMARHAVATRSAPCWAGLYAYGARLDAPDILREAGSIAWAARNNSKPGRSGPEAWTLHASPEWSIAHLEEDATRVARLLLKDFAAAVGREALAPISLTAHRWRYAQSGATDHRSLWNDRLAMGTCGDWLIGPRVESAWLSGRDLARTIMAGADVAMLDVQAFGT